MNNNKMIRIARSLIKHDKAFSLFIKCLQEMEINKANRLGYFELLHEFGHIDVAVELGATIKELKICNVVMKFDEYLEIISISKETNDNSYCGLYFINDVAIDAKLEMVARGGLDVSTKALKYSLFNFKSLCFNFVNSNYWFLPKKDSDKDLVKQFRNKEYAQQFNEKWKNNYMDTVSI